MIDIYVRGSVMANDIFLLNVATTEKFSFGACLITNEVLIVPLHFFLKCQFSHYILNQ